jgi:3-methyladenine DNA glycosylase/8-oxoguanine DNA glycosylase
MALISEITCSKCGKTKFEVVNYTGKCNQCLSEEKNKSKRMYLASLKGLTVQERLSKIEEYLYDLKSELNSIEQTIAPHRKIY